MKGVGVMLPWTEINVQSIRNVPRLVIGAPQGRSGKTTFTLGLLRAFNRKGIMVQPFKKGPDFIDPSWHSAAAGRACRNLDAFFMDSEQIRLSLIKASQGSQLSIIEGAMGLYDGLDLTGSCSTAEVAKITESPVLLVVDATRMTRSVAAMVMGYQHFDPEVRIAGVVLNKIARPRHESLMREAIEQFCGIPVIGAIPKDVMLAIPDRHLGLVTNGEIAGESCLLDYLADVVCKHVDLDRVCAIANQAPEMIVSRKADISRLTGYLHRNGAVPGPRIGVIQDCTFSFYYPENIEALQNLGAEIVKINSLVDAHLPGNLDALYIGGGFPEVFAQELEQNQSLRQGIQEAAEEDLPIYAECGGLMYLGRSIQVEDKNYQMVGVLPFDTILEKKPQGHGYTLMQPSAENLWFAEGEVIRGHEFHNSRIINLDPEVQFGFTVQRGHGIDGVHDGICYKNVFAAYNHIHAIGCPAWAKRFVQQAVDCQVKKMAQRERVAGE